MKEPDDTLHQDLLLEHYSPNHSFRLALRLRCSLDELFSDMLPSQFIPTRFRQIGRQKKGFGLTGMVIDKASDWISFMHRTSIFNLKFLAIHSLNLTLKKAPAYAALNSLIAEANRSVNSRKHEEREACAVTFENPVLSFN
jgi:hypothetical protein